MSESMVQTKTFLDKLETASEQAAEPRWGEDGKKTFRDFLEVFESTKEITDDEDNEKTVPVFPNLGVLAHQRVYNMIMAAGTKKVDHFGQERIEYKFFEDHFYGIEQTIDELMAYISSAAQRTETSRRMLLLWGPPGGGKSDVVNTIKRGLERYSHTDEGAIFAVYGSKMHENPFLLVPKYLRKDFLEKYGIPIEGTLNPETRWRLEHEHDGRFLDFPIERIFFSEDDRVGIGTWLPSDTKSQDISDLVGGIDYSKIQEFGDDSDPRVYNFDGELFVSNRGVMEFIEGIKADEKFLRACLTVTQEKLVKAPKFGQIYCDEFVIMHTNETEFRTFMGEKRYEAYHDRMNLVKVPHNLGMENEVKIYRKLLANSDAEKSVKIAPRTLEAAAMFSALTRLEEPSDGGDLTLIKKMKLYDGQDVKGYKSEQVIDLRRKAKREGLDGVSPRFIIDQISAAISKARETDRNFITALDVLRSLNMGIENRDAYTEKQKTEYETLIDTARSEWNDMLRDDIQKAFFLSYEDEARDLCENYLDQIGAACAEKKPRDPVTGEEVDLDEKLMDAIEIQIDVSSSGKVDFRNEILRTVGELARKNMKFDYTRHAQLREGIQKALFEERKNVIRMTVSTRSPDPEALKRLNDVIARMCDKQGYSAEAANELLKYASAHLFEK